MEYKVNTYQDYLNYLFLYKKQYGDMTSNSIYQFLSKHNLTDRFGITYRDVVSDFGNLDNLRSSNKLNASALNAGGGTVGKAKGNHIYAFLISEWAKIVSKLTYGKLSDLIVANHLDKKYGLTVEDVVADIKVYINGQASNEQIYKNEKIDNGIKSNRVDKIDFYKKIESKEEYIDALKKHMDRWKDKAYLNDTIERLASEYCIGERGNQYLDDIRMDLVLVSAGQRPSSKLSKTYSEKQHENTTISLNDKFIKELSEVLNKYDYLLTKKSSFEGILWDFFPDMKKEINVLIKLFETGILEDIGNQDVLGSMFVNRYINKLANEYGIDVVTSKRIIEIWCVVYGRDYLHKIVEFDV